MTASRRVKLDPQLTLYMNHLKRQQRLKHRAWNHENKRKTQGERRDMGVDKVSLDMTPKAQAARQNQARGSPVNINPPSKGNSHRKGNGCKRRCVQTTHLTWSYFSNIQGAHTTQLKVTPTQFLNGHRT